MNLNKVMRKMMFEYSAINIRENSLEPNSVLNPLTSSLSLSEKSKGVRFISAREVGRNIMKVAIKKKIGFSMILAMFKYLNDLKIQMIVISKIMKDAS